MSVGALVVTVVLLAGNAFFVAGEFAIIASRRTQIEAEAGRSRRGRWTLSAMSQLPLMVAGTQLGVTICSLGLGAAAEPAFARLLRIPFEAVHVPDGLVHPVSFVLALAIVTYLHTVLGEMVPKNLTLVGPERAVLWLAPPLLGFCTITRPVLMAVQWLARLVLKLFRIEPPDEAKSVFNADEFAGLVSESRTEGLLAEPEHARLAGALALGRLTAADALLPWMDVVAVPDDISPAALELTANRTHRSRFPVVARSSRRVLGFIHVKDVLEVTGPARRKPLPATAIRPLPVVAPNRTLADLLLSMRRGRHHIALVGTEGAPIGIVTLDDVLSAVVGTSESAAPRTR
ncbi:hemolysin family protein [Actinocatenispora thailandica]|uniref:hemolysin family protein n=1 Tax=Actinocatenispora thailandica TaxID=227318 RepID=UPI00194F700C|nr:hemolysin family protein [Actinocatenispora thailandica]